MILDRAIPTLATAATLADTCLATSGAVLSSSSSGSFARVVAYPESASTYRTRGHRDSASSQDSQRWRCRGPALTVTRTQ